MDSPLFTRVPDWSTGCNRGVQGVVCDLCRHSRHRAWANDWLFSGLPTSIFGNLESVRIRPNPTPYRIRPNPEPVSVGSKCPYGLYNTAKKNPAGLLGIRPNPPESARIRPSTESVRIPNRHPPSYFFPGCGVSWNTR